MAIDARKLFITAESFRLAVDLLREAGKTIYTYPLIVNDALACELYLKCLVTIQTGLHPRGHELHKLYNKLSSTGQARVEHHYKLLSGNDPEHAANALKSPSKSNALRAVLKDGAKVFEKVRYWYEGNVPDMRGDFRWPIAALRAVILEIHPDWTPTVENWTKPAPGGR